MSTLFWHQAWFGEKPLKEMFPRLFSLSNDENSAVSSLGWWDGDVWCWMWGWRRPLFVWEEDIQKIFLDTMVAVVMTMDVEDAWVWKIGNSKVYTISSVYEFLLANSPLFSSIVDESTLFKSFWISSVPRKALAFS